MSRVNLFVIGVQKAGTSWLYTLLDQHPAIFMAEEKELYFFGTEGATGPGSLEAYHAHFPFGDGHTYYGDATPLYYRDPDVAAEIRRYNSEARVIAQVRDPIRRLVSQYRYRKQIGRLAESVSLEMALDGRDPNLVRDSHYERTLPPFSEAFGSQFRVVSLESFKQSPDDAWASLLSFLGAAPTPFPDASSGPENPTGSAAFRRLYRTLIRPIKRHAPGVYRRMLRSPLAHSAKQVLLQMLGTAEPEVLSPEVRARLLDEFAPTYEYLREQGFDHYPAV